MKRFGRVVSMVVIALGVFWLCRAWYVYRVWQMASLWYPMVPAPSLADYVSVCLSPQAAASTAHGAFADIAFVKIPLNAEDAGNEPSRQSLGILGKKGVLVPVPLTYDLSAEHCSTAPSRNNPRLLPAAVWGNCYNVAGLFDTRSVKRGSAIAQRSVNGGLVVFDRDRRLLYMAAYRTR